MDIVKILSEEFSILPVYITNIINMLDEGATVPFIARYRKENTNSCDDQTLRSLADRLSYLRGMQKRREEILKAISVQDKLTPEIETQLDEAKTLTELEDIYRPFRPKKRTRASIAKEKGLEPLAGLILKQECTDIEAAALEFVDVEKGVNSAEEAIGGAKDIIAEIISDDAALRKKIRSLLTKNGVITTKLTDSENENAKTYEMYAEHSEFVSQIKSHRVLAINRGEKEGFLKVKIEVDKEIALKICAAQYIKSQNACSALVKQAADDSFERLIFPSVEREVRAELTAAAGEQAIKMFEVNLKPLLMQPPLKDKVVMGLDPGYRTGCKLAVVDATGKVLDKGVIFAAIGNNQAAKEIFKDMIERHKVEVIAIGNGTASKESEIFVAQNIKDISHKVEYTVVSEAGASVYSASKTAAEEFPDFDVSERSAVSIARRLQDPLAELIKIDPKSIGVGQYQHDMDAGRLDSVLKGVLEDCVNSVGVDLNTASAQLLNFVSGLNTTVAKNIIDRREKLGKFRRRSELLEIPKLGAKTFEQCAGFLRIVGGEDILDNTAVHPESYQKVKTLLKTFNYTEKDVEKGGVADLPEKIRQRGINSAAKEIGLGTSTLNDIVSELLKPGRDIRSSLPQPVLRSDILSINDLKPNTILTGTVRNVIDFGAFIDIGVHQDGLVHISKITDRYIRHPSEVLKVGQQVKVMVESVDLRKNRISLTMRNITEKE